MFAIKVGVEKDYEDFYTSQPVNEISESREQIFEFFKNFIDQNIIINLCQIEFSEVTKKNDTLYYSTTLENAQEFQRCVENTTTTEFSLKKFWTNLGFRFYSSISDINEIDFNSESGNLIPLIEHKVDINYKIVWGL